MPSSKEREREAPYQKYPGLFRQPTNSRFGFSLGSAIDLSVPNDETPISSPITSSPYILGALESGPNALEIVFHIHNSQNKQIPVKTLIDSGASGNFIDCAFTATIQLNQTQLDEPITVRNVDGSINRGGSITTVTTADTPG